MAENEDALDRKAAWIERMFDRLFLAIKENVFATLLVLAIGVIFWQQTTINSLNELRLDDVKYLNEKINAAVEKRVEKETQKQLAPIKAQQDSTTKKLDTSLNKLNNTIDNVNNKYN